MFRFDAFYEEQAFSKRLVRNPRYDELPGWARNDDRLLPHRMISSQRTQFKPFMILAVPKQLAPKEQKPDKPIVQGRHL